MKQQAKLWLNRISFLFLALAVIVAGVLLVSPMDGTATWNGTVATTFASGSGTASSPYIINTEAQLGYFLSELSKDVTYEGKHIRLGKSLDMTGGAWTAAGTFEGTLDGYGYTITTPFALFDTIGANGTVKRLCVVCTETLERAPLAKTNAGIIESTVVSGTVSTSGSGGIICDSNDGTVRNCGALGSVTAYDPDGCDAGMIGKFTGTIEHCYSAVSASASGGGKYDLSDDGPIHGYKSSSSARVSDCYYNKESYPSATDQGTPYTTAEMTSAAFLSTMNIGSVPGCNWVLSSTSGPFAGYPVPTPGHDAVTSLAYTSESVATYHTSTLSTQLTSTGSGTIYYTLDGTNPTTSSTRKTYTNGSTLNLSGDFTVHSVAYSGGLYGPVTQQKLIYLPGGGTESDPYRISTKTQLDAVRLDLNAHYVLMNDLTFTDADFADGGVAPGGWIAIGKVVGEGSYGFSGTFNGNGHAIYNLSGQHGGLFEANNGIIQNLRIIDHTLFDDYRCGAIANSNGSTGSILRCYTKSAFTVNCPPTRLGEDMTGVYQAYYGGIVGQNSGTVQYCWNDGVGYGYSAPKYGRLYVGGIVGYGDASNCYNTGTVYAHNWYNSVEFAYIGGISGSDYSFVSNCRNDGALRGQVSVSYELYCGDIISYNYHRSSDRCVSVPLSIDSSGSALGSGVVRSRTAAYYPDSTDMRDYQQEYEYYSLDFETEWMMTENGPIPQGLMDADGRCLSVGSYTAPTCEKTGTIVYRDAYTSYTKSWTVPATGHNYGDWTSLDGTDLHIRTCSTEGCGKYETAAHSWEVTEVVDATCTEDGYAVYECDCSASKTVTDTGSAIGHSYTEYVSNGDATCTEDGTKTALCDNGCGTGDTKTDEGSKLGHSYTNYVSNGDATCTEDGTKTALCDNGCGTGDTKTDEGSKLGHSYTEYVSNGDATCTGDGTKTALCDNGCGAGDTKTDAGSKLGHSYTNYVSNGDATCTEDGTKTALCDYGCGAKETLPDPGSAAGHDHGAWNVTTAAGYLTEGEETRICGCGDTETRPIPATGPAAAKAAKVSYDSSKQTVSITNAPKDVTVVIAAYDSNGRMVFVTTTTSAETALSVSLAGVKADRVQVFFLLDWTPIGTHHTVSMK